MTALDYVRRTTAHGRRADRIRDLEAWHADWESRHGSAIDLALGKHPRPARNPLIMAPMFSDAMRDVYISDLQAALRARISAERRILYGPIPADP